MADTDPLTQKDLDIAITQAVADTANAVGDAVGKAVSSKISGKFKVVAVKLDNVDKQLEQARVDRKDLFDRCEENKLACAELTGTVATNKQEVETNKKEIEGAVKETNEKISTSRYWVGIILSLLAIGVTAMGLFIAIAK